MKGQALLKVDMLAALWLVRVNALTEENLVCPIIP